VVALDGDGEERWDQVDYRGHIALVVGAEGKGVSRLVRERSDHRVALPLRGRVASLNASAAFAAVMYEVVRQQGG
jgi:23S rRNA (guanosine2251-2'-O)-methyltransferase